MLLDRQGVAVPVSRPAVDAWQQVQKQTGPARLQGVLTGNLYQIHAIDKPPVEESELAAALPFAIKDLVNLPMDRVHVDYFQLAVQPAGTDKLQVVVTDKALLTKLVGDLDHAGYTPELFTVEELALLNLLPQHDRPQMLLWHLPGQPLKVLFALDGKLLFSRPVRGFNQLDSMTAEELQMGLVDALLLELQRSIDYLDRQLRQAPVAGLSLLLPLTQQNVLADLLAQQLELPVQALTDNDRDPRHWLAHAAALERIADEAEH